MQHYLDKTDYLNYLKKFTVITEPTLLIFIPIKLICFQFIFYANTHVYFYIV